MLTSSKRVLWDSGIGRSYDGDDFTVEKNGVSYSLTPPGKYKSVRDTRFNN